jgi:imidazolonepropionase-like amidohydrolase
MKKFNTMRYLTVLFLLCGLAAVYQEAAAQITEKPGHGQYAITGADIHTVSDGTIEDGILLINGDYIEYVGEDTEIPGDYTRIEADGKYLYPGFIDSDTQLGLVEIRAVGVTVDDAELGDFNPQVRAFTAVNPHSVAVPVTRVSGVTNVVSVPTSGVVAGKSTLIDLWGYSPDSMAVRSNSGLHLSFPSSGRQGWYDDRSEEEIEKEFEEDMKALNDFWEEAEFYHEMMTAYENDSQNKSRPDKSIKMDAMQEVIAGELPVIINVNRERDIKKAIEWTEKHPDIDFIFQGVAEGWRVADELAEAGIPCLVSTLYTPVRDYDNYQRPYQNPGKMMNAGVKVAIASGDTENVRNLLFHAGYAAAYGMGVEEAVRAVTMNPAEIFGVSDKIGSLEEGKQANLFISDGDPFEPTTQIEQVFIRGFKIPMTSRHIQLYDQFLDRNAVSN